MCDIYILTCTHYSLTNCDYPHFIGKWNPRGLEVFPPAAFLLERTPCSFVFQYKIKLSCSLLGKLINSAHKHGRLF